MNVNILSSIIPASASDSDNHFVLLLQFICRNQGSILAFSEISGCACNTKGPDYNCLDGFNYSSSDFDKFIDNVANGVDDDFEVKFTDEVFKFVYESTYETLLYTHESTNGKIVLSLDNNPLLLTNLYILSGRIDTYFDMCKGRHAVADSNTTENIDSCTFEKSTNTDEEFPDLYIRGTAYECDNHFNHNDSLGDDYYYDQYPEFSDDEDCGYGAAIPGHGYYIETGDNYEFYSDTEEDLLEQEYFYNKYNYKYLNSDSDVSTSETDNLLISSDSEFLEEPLTEVTESSVEGHNSESEYESEPEPQISADTDELVDEIDKVLSDSKEKGYFSSIWSSIWG